MGFDALLKKYFLIAVLALVAIATFFQATGAMQLVGAMLIPDSSALAVLPPVASGTGKASTTPRSADPILSRNPFDLSTGPLNAKTLGDQLPVTEEVNPTDPLRSPRCTDIKVTIITESPDPLWSIAALQGPGDTRPAVHRVGDELGSSKVAYIGYNSYEGSPSVWLVQGAAVCQALLFATQPQPQAAPAKGGAVPAAVGSAAAAKRGAPSIPADMKAKIQRVSATEFNVDRGVVDKILENQADLMRSARVVPEQQDGKVVGVRLFGIRPDTLLGTLGLENGDRLETINGFAMASPEKALEAYARLRTAEKLSVSVNRRGQPVTLEFNIK
ncbi:MAG: general secretion pathway protein GspC [Polyangiaceae bacterium]|nr:general secretion pathway protein GspC [Polyangiaceae bacterium]